MHIIYTRHAEQRMRQRKVSPEQVAETLEAPDDILSGENGKEIAARRYGARQVHVVYTVMKPRLHIRG